MDEAHRSKNEDRPEGVELKLEEKKRFDNRMGEVVDFYAEHQPDEGIDGVGPLWMATATPMRGDYHGMIADRHFAKFVEYVNPAADHLELMWHLREIRNRVLVGDPDLISEHLFQEIGREAQARRDAGEPTYPTLWYQPHAGNRVMLPNGSEDKSRLLRSYMDLAESRGLKCLDLVTDDETRNKKLKVLRDTIRKAEWAELPDVVFFQDLGREGFDLPPACRVVVMGARISPTLVTQIYGRPLRDWCSCKPKCEHEAGTCPTSKRWAEYVVVLPFNGEAELTEGDQVWTYLQAILSLLAIEWRFSPLYKHRTVQLQAKMAELLPAIVKLGLELGDEATDEDVSEGIRDLCTDMGLDADDADAAEADSHALFSTAQKLMMSGAQGIEYGPELEKGVLGNGLCRAYIRRFQRGTFNEFRSRILGARALDPDTLRRNVALHRERNLGSPPNRKSGRLLDYPEQPGLTWEHVHHALTRGTRGLQVYGSLSQFIDGKWLDEFLADFDHDDRLAWGLDYKTFEDYLRANRREQVYVKNYAKMKRCRIIFGEKFLRHPKVTTELVEALGCALGDRKLEDLAKKNSKERAAFGRLLHQKLDEGYVSPSEAVKQFKRVLAGEPWLVVNDTAASGPAV